jgi:hypothetical protein
VHIYIYDGAEYQQSEIRITEVKPGSDRTVGNVW